MDNSVPISSDKINLPRNPSPVSFVEIDIGEGGGGGGKKEMTRAEYVTALIATTKGRYPITTICPSCKISMTSKTPSVENKWMCTFIIGNLLSIVFAVGAMVLLIAIIGIRQSIIWALDGNELVANILAGICGILLLIAGMICCCKCCSSRNTPIDVPHYCPLCNAYLGVNTGEAECNRKKKQRDCE